MKGFRKLWDRVLKVAVVAIATCAGVLLSVWWLHRSGKLQPLELYAYDTMLRLHLQPTELGAANDVVIVGIDEYDARLMDHFPVYDAEKVALLKALEAAQPSAIGVDIYLDVPTGFDSAKTQELRDVLASQSNIVCGYLVATGTASNPDVPPAMGRVKGTRLVGRRVGIVDQPFDADSVSRRGLLYETNLESGETAQSLDLGVTNRFLESTGTLKRPTTRDDVSHVDGFWKQKLRQFQANDGAYVNADAGGFQYLADYRGPAQYPTYRLRQIIKFDEDKLNELPQSAWPLPHADPSVFRNKIVLVGMTSTAMKDYIFTPLHRAWGYFGIEQHALLVDQLVRTARDGSQPLRVWSSTSEWSWTTIWAILGILAGLSARIGYSPRAPWRLIVIGIVGELTLLGVSALLFSKGTWVPMVPPSICWVATISIVGAYISQLERTDRNVLNNLFVKICQAEIATELWKRRDEILDGGKLKPKRLSATLMFSDLHGFSTECEKMDENLIIKWLDRYHDTMSSIVSRYHGVTVKYMGDGMMAVFGAPRTSDNGQLRTEDARNAVNCALEMRRKMKELHTEWAGENLPCLSMRIGIQSGDIVEGSLGSASRMEYVTLGDTVNVASRLESLDKKIMDDDITGGVCRIVIGEQTAEIVNDQFQLKSFPNHEIRGRAKLMDVYGVTTDNQPGPPVVPE